MALFNPGQVLTADDLNAGLGVRKYKLVDESVSSATTGTTLQNDDHLFADVKANGVYGLFLETLYNSGATPDFKQDFTAPAGTVFGSSYFLYSATGTVAMGPTGALGSVTGLAGNGANDVAFLLSAMVFVGGTDGVLNWRWAQNVADAGLTTVRKGSRLTLVQYA